jgi:hypothetical protein
MSRVIGAGPLAAAQRRLIWRNCSAMALVATITTATTSGNSPYNGLKSLPVHGRAQNQSLRNCGYAGRVRSGAGFQFLNKHFGDAYMDRPLSAPKSPGISPVADDLLDFRMRLLRAPVAWTGRGRCFLQSICELVNKNAHGFGIDRRGSTKKARPDVGG